jgi:hypothetical protein
MSNRTPPDDAGRPRKRGGSHTPGRGTGPGPTPGTWSYWAPVIAASCAAYLAAGLEVIIQEARDVASRIQSPTS